MNVPVTAMSCKSTVLIERRRQTPDRTRALTVAQL